jgi:hypothetical protein
MSIEQEAEWVPDPVLSLCREEEISTPFRELKDDI